MKVYSFVIAFGLLFFSRSCFSMEDSSNGESSQAQLLEEMEDFVRAQLEKKKPNDLQPKKRVILHRSYLSQGDDEEDYVQEDEEKTLRKTQSSKMSVFRKLVRKSRFNHLSLNQ